MNNNDVKLEEIIDGLIEFTSTILAVFMAIGLIATLFVGLIKFIIWVWTI
jgi:hypothetical protein